MGFKVEVKLNRESSATGYESRIVIHYYDIVVNGKHFGECVHYPKRDSDINSWKLVKNSLKIDLSSKKNEFYSFYKDVDSLKDFIQESLVSRWNDLKEFMN